MRWILGRRELRGRDRRICLEVPVHALVATILLRGGGLDEVGEDAELDPPDRELRQATERHGRERRTVVGADALRET
jgi:hypothetical protein